MSNLLPRAVFVCAWLAALGTAAFIAGQYSSATQFFGIADDQEQTVRFSNPVEIVEIRHVSGEEVARGDVVMRVRQPLLEADIAFVQEQLQGLSFSDRENSTTIDAQIVKLNSDLRTSIAQLDTGIKNLEARKRTARELFKDASGGAGLATIDREIESLRVNRSALIRSTNTTVASLRSQLSIGTRPIDAEIAELRKRLDDLQRQRRSMTVTASLSGRIGSILFKVGDTVPPYQPIATIHSAKPTYVNGYIHEAVSNDIKKNDTVWVTSVNQMEESLYKGVVESLGARIVEFPLRLKVNPMAQAWGREVVVRLEGQHDLLLGEKVSVQAQQPNQIVHLLRAALAPKQAVAAIEVDQ
ncbi:MAG: HlyD family efflux transporter periplasmic adaptor subunit [Pseudomonadales bacterium]|nr:HlyD family efflux transporter periplasmic adaptor subunit [Pseudomonadales bacterium]